MFILFALDLFPLSLFAPWLPAALIGTAVFGSLLVLPWLFADMLRRPGWPRGRWH